MDSEGRYMPPYEQGLAMGFTRSEARQRHMVLWGEEPAAELVLEAEQRHAGRVPHRLIPSTPSPPLSLTEPAAEGSGRRVRAHVRRQAS